MLSVPLAVPRMSFELLLTWFPLNEWFIRTVVIIFAPPTLVHVVMAVYVGLLIIMGSVILINRI